MESLDGVAPPKPIDAAMFNQVVTLLRLTVNFDSPLAKLQRSPITTRMTVNHSTKKTPIRLGPATGLPKLTIHLALMKS